MRSIPLPTRRLILLVLAAAPLFLLGWSLAVAVDLALLAAIVLDGILMAREPSPEVECRAPGVVSLHAPFEVELRVRNRADRETEVLLTGDLPEGLERAGEERRRLRVPPGGVSSARFEVHARERGEHVLGDAHLRIVSPLGLLFVERREPLRIPVRVQPGVDEVRRYRLLALHHRLREMGVRPVGARGVGTSFESLREYIRGDDPRHIDWKASARHAKLIVRQYEAERSQSLLLVIDAGRAMRERIGGGERLDHALAAALLLAHVARAHDDRVGLLVFSDRVHRFLTPARIGLDRLAAPLGEVESRPVEPDYPEAFRHLARSLSRRSLVVVFSDVLGDRESRSLLAHLGATVRRHLPILVALRNPATEEIAAEEPVDEGAVYRRVAAEELLEHRARALHRMRRRGVTVVDALPRSAVAETVNAYLDVKRRGLL